MSEKEKEKVDKVQEEPTQEQVGDGAVALTQGKGMEGTQDKEVATTSRVSGEGGRPAGMEDADMKEDILMPRVAVLQGLSELVTEGKGSMGDIADSLSGENLGKEITFIPLFLFKTRVAFKTGEGLVMRSSNGLTITQASEEYQDRVGQPCDDIPESQWDGKNPPLLSKVFNFPSLIVGKEKEMPISVTFLRTGMKAGKILISLIARSGEDAFARKYKLSTKLEKNEKGTFAVPVIELVGVCTDAEYAAAKKWFTTLRGKSIDIDMEENTPDFD